MEPGSSGEIGTDNFTVLPDVYFDPFECDVFDQDCEVGEKCVPMIVLDETSLATKCVPVQGDGAWGDPCEVVGEEAPGVDNCAFGHLCWYLDDAGAGTCIAMCTRDRGEAVCTDGFECVSHADVGVFWLCKPSCDPLMQDCSSGDTCVMEAYDFVCVPDTSGEEGQANDVCESWGDCDPGLACVANVVSVACDVQHQRCCTPFCELPDGSCPNPDQACLPWYSDGDLVPPGEEDIGLCAIPR